MASIASPLVFNHLGHGQSESHRVQGGSWLCHNESASQGHDATGDTSAVFGADVPAVGGTPFNELRSVNKGLHHRVEEAVLFMRRVDEAVFSPPLVPLLLAWLGSPRVLRAWGVSSLAQRHMSGRGL